MSFNLAKFKTLGDFTPTNIISEVIEVEGGYVNNPNDRGGETNYGITKAVAVANGYAGAMRELTKAKAYDIYYNVYWKKNRCDELMQIHPLLAFHVFDMAVNSGSGAVIKHVQRLLNVVNRGGKDYADVSVDGAIGPGTVRAIQDFVKRNGQTGLRYFIINLIAMQSNFYISITENRPQNEAFTNGWLSRAASKLEIAARLV